jgi:hypothetical protein
MVHHMNSIKSEDGLTHGWDESDPNEWHHTTSSNSRHLLGIIALIIFVAVFAVVLIGGAATAPIAVPGFAIGALIYGFSFARKIR